MARIAAPEENFVDVLAFFFCGGDGDIGAGLVIDPFAVAVVSIRVN